MLVFQLSGQKKEYESNNTLLDNSYLED